MFPAGTLYISGILFCYIITAVFLWSWVIRSGESFRNKEINHSELIIKYFFQLIWVGILVLVVLMAGGFLAHQDTAWHQLTLSNEKTMLPRTLIYTFLYPGYVITGGAAWLHARSHFPEKVTTKMKIAFFFATFAPFAFLPAQDPDLLNLSTDFYNILFRSAHWILNIVWIIAIAHIILCFISFIIESLGRSH